MDYRKNNHIEPWDDRVYGTGSTEPPKEHDGLLALLLITVIFLSGLTSALGILNIKLFRELQEQNVQTEHVPISFSNVEETAASSERMVTPEFYSGKAAASIPQLGLEGNYVSQFEQTYFHWPAGLLVTVVNENSDAFSQGIEPGDIVTRIGDTQIDSQENLDTALKTRKPGDQLALTVYRDGQELPITLTLSN